MKYFPIILAFFGLFSCQKQENKTLTLEETTTASTEKIEVAVHSRVDMTNTEVKEIASLWTNYLNTEPDKISDNNNWNKEEKEIYRDFDLSRALLYQFPSKDLLQYFKPKILSITKEGENYSIRTIYSADGLEGEYSKSDPWAIQKLYAIKEDKSWKLKNSLPILTADWAKKKIGKITFIYPSNHTFNQSMAEKAGEFCQSIIEEFEFPDYEPFDYYITQNGDELGQLLNFDFFFAGYTTGIGFNENRILMSGFGSEYYPHEFIHLIVPKFDRHSLLEEGFATWKGGQGGISFGESAKIFANALSRNEAVTFLEIINKKWGWEYASFYTSGAILCHAAFEKGGVALVNELLTVPQNDERLIKNLCLIFDIEEKNFEAFWRAEALKFKSDSNSK
ncbi:hypothetical protein Belba_1518 [Belliella baltica DSM 15883]|uniref:Peptidase MA-like domain-containing protein n=1 Tax=Belliella baltica (strain DSM 15883 / CIP 108006 / LMG 21964 / BA134) TaxID=866536 RepID=I3Z4G2_BELBD|nr:hypothetical protein [Belliella baltica]AFL84130.1 hypothetical protein Belba_1518 [Belliella baltica DSM 15883]